jgi:hypothetical protein
MIRFGNWIEDHQLAVQTIKEENDRLLNDLSEARKECELLINDKEQLIDELKQSLAAAYEAKELLTTEHETMVQSMEESKLSLIQELTASKQELAQLYKLSREGEKMAEYDEELDNQLRVELQQSRTIV